MENIKRFQFKTNINCGGCIAKVKPYLDQTPGIAHWEVDITDQNKILTVESDGISEEEIMEIVGKTGYRAEPHRT